VHHQEEAEKDPRVVHRSRHQCHREKVPQGAELMAVPVPGVPVVAGAAVPVVPVLAVALVPAVLVPAVAVPGTAQPIDPASRSPVVLR
jgi:hypothetical protein